MRTLYLGLNPSRYYSGAFHYPVIQTIPLKIDISRAIKATHFLFTSQSAVNYWMEIAPVHGRVLAIGPATLAALKGRNIQADMAPQATQEGLVELLKTIDLSQAFLFWPRSSSARSIIEEFLQKNNISFDAPFLYETKTQKPQPMPDLNDFDEIVFTSPSTVAAFCEIFGKIPNDKKLTPIGPVTQQALSRLV